ncbi:precorrin-8X methylmutase [Desulfotomaculum arcticum]|uniref:Precorrin-8X methylmutase n=1 Tax=Desulfotruncus arcticus DSM 17038 TaxID=1121424 RepID=A0A1I2RVY1_9FIRM|nr:precorrin-8X methylmutase [Desulfotruncus arcticus]SFG44640.1 precorrin-8X methylmutase [Desulfotomaculum arcticum] [Desulfotruncus arcticus DSM 17038]
MKYCIDPQAIERESMAIIEKNVPELMNLPVGEKAITKRIIHTTGDFNIASLVRIHPEAVGNGLNALRNGCKLISDVNMVLAGLNKNKLNSLNVESYCLINDPLVIKEAAATGQTRAMVAMQRAGTLSGDIVVIGNAPTALFTLCEMIESGKVKPALVVGTPVGFVGAAESKDLLVALNKVPYVTILSTRGGSTIAASIINALLLQI